MTIQNLKNMAESFQTGRKHCENRRNCSLRAISPFSQCFQKACFPEASKGVIVWEWVNGTFKVISVISRQQLTYSCFPGAHLNKARALKCLAQDIFTKKPRGSKEAGTWNLKVMCPSPFH